MDFHLKQQLKCLLLIVSLLSSTRSSPLQPVAPTLFSYSVPTGPEKELLPKLCARGTVTRMCHSVSTLEDLASMLPFCGSPASSPRRLMALRRRHQKGYHEQQLWKMQLRPARPCRFQRVSGTHCRAAEAECCSHRCGWIGSPLLAGTGRQVIESCSSE